MPRGGAAPGERRGGRSAGTPNKIGQDVRAAAAIHGPAAVRVLASIMADPNAPAQARVAAANAILDRWAGRPPQAITGADGGPLGAVVKIVNQYTAPPAAPVAPTTCGPTAGPGWFTLADRHPAGEAP